MKNGLAIAIDGPAGAGKGTVAKLVAKKLGLEYIDTGAMYRAVALFSKRQNIPWTENPEIGPLAESLQFEFRTADNKQHIIVNGEDISDLIRTHDISDGSSKVAAVPEVAKALLVKQREIGLKGNAVLEGRQIGTGVLPDADVKIYMTASPEVRAKRRMLDLEKRGETMEYQTVLKDIIERDERDANRPFAPLRKPEDAIEINTDNMTIDEVVEKILGLIPTKDTGNK